MLKLNYKVIVKHRTGLYDLSTNFQDNSPDIEIKQIVSFKKTNDINKLSSFATLEIPIKNIVLPKTGETFIYYKGAEDNKIYFGNEIEISLGYNGTINKIFTGYITNLAIKKDTIELELQDRMYYFKKQKRISFSYDSISLKDLLKTMSFDKIPHNWDEDNILDFTLPQIRTNDPLTPAEILKMLSDNYGFYSYYINDVFHCGHKYTLKNDEYLTIFEYPYFNAMDNFILKAQYLSPTQTKGYPIIKNNLNKTYISNKLISIVNVIQDDGSKTTYYITSDFSDVQVTTGDIPSTIQYDASIILNEPKLDENSAKTLCKDNFVNYPTSNYTGSFTTFGYPTMYLGNTLIIAQNLSKHTNVQLSDIDINTFLIEKITTTFDNKGYRQNIFIDNNYLSPTQILKN